jgi:hypothetical protein
MEQYKGTKYERISRRGFVLHAMKFDTVTRIPMGTESLIKFRYSSRDRRSYLYVRVA